MPASPVPASAPMPMPAVTPTFTPMPAPAVEPGPPTPTFMTPPAPGNHALPQSNRTRWRLRPTLRGPALFVGGLALTWVGNQLALDVATWAGALVFGVLCASSLWLVVFSGSLHLSRSFSSPTFSAGESGRVAVSAARTGVALVPGGVWQDHFAGFTVSDEHGPIPRGAGREVIDFQATFGQRGVHLFGPVSCVWHDPFGVWTVQLVSQKCDAIVVTPAVVPLHIASATASVSPHRLSSTESAALLREPDVTLRDYVSGDPLRRINWKASARTGDLKVRNDGDDVAPPRVVVRVDESALAREPSHREWALSAAASVLAAAARVGLVSWLVLPSGEAFRDESPGTTTSIRLGMIDFEDEWAEFLPTPRVFTARADDVVVTVISHQDIVTLGNPNAPTNSATPSGRHVMLPVPADSALPIAVAWQQATRTAGHR